MSNRPPVNRRKSFLIDREIQVGITLRFVVIFAIFVIVSSSVIFLPSALQLITGGTVDELAGPASEFLLLHKRIWPMVLVIVAGTVIYSLFFTHRIAGPIYRLNKELKNMIDGNFPQKITLRDRDFFKETATLLEELSNRQRRGIDKEERLKYEEIRQKLSKLKERVGELETGGELMEIIESLETLIKHRGIA